jgi:hypothetical protein
MALYGTCALRCLCSLSYTPTQRTSVACRCSLKCVGIVSQKLLCTLKTVLCYYKTFEPDFHPKGGHDLRIADQGERTANAGTWDDFNAKGNAIAHVHGTRTFGVFNISNSTARRDRNGDTRKRLVLEAPSVPTVTGHGPPSAPPTT